MRIALNKEDKRVDINNIINSDYKKENFYCPICSSEVVVKNGSINIPHFAHKTLEDCDSFTSDMSEWHKAWQEKFPEENREVIIEYNGEKHRADVCINNCVIEFQHSPISQEEFDKRCDFYNNAGYTLFWIFDHTNSLAEYDEDDYYISGNIFLYDNLEGSRSLFTGEYITNEKEWISDYTYIETTHKDTGSKYRWKNASKFMKNFVPQEQYNAFICFDFGGGIERIKWTVINQYNEADYNFFITEPKIDYNDLVKYFENRNKNNICPECNYPLVIKNGKYGNFLGCSNYPYCKHTQKINIEKK